MRTSVPRSPPPAAVRVNAAGPGLRALLSGTVRPRDLSRDVGDDGLLGKPPDLCPHARRCPNEQRSCGVGAVTGLLVAQGRSAGGVHVHAATWNSRG